MSIQNVALIRGAEMNLTSLYDMLMDGGPLMVPIGLCSIVALAYTVERSVRLRAGRLGTERQGRKIVAGVRQGGARGGIELVDGDATPLARVIAAGLRRAGHSVLDMERAAEDCGTREVKRLAANLRPLVVVAMIAPLLGLLGTVWGMIDAFTNIALKEGLGKPELLASGISQALITTAAGLAVAIPTQAVYYYFRSRIDRFARLAEDVQLGVTSALEARQEAA